MAKLPNIHTLQIVHAHSLMAPAFKKAFSRGKYPQIREVILPSCAHPVLKACPEVERITCIEDDGADIVSSIGLWCPKVEVLHNVFADAEVTQRKSYSLSVLCFY